MSILSMLLALFLQQPPQTPPTPPATAGRQGAPTTQPAPATQPATTQPAAPRYDEGPLRAELFVIQEFRKWSDDPNISARLPVGMQLVYRIQGERIGEVARYGKLVFTELTDDSGESLLDPNTYSPIERVTTAQTPYPPDRLRENGIIIPQRVKATARKAQLLKVGRGGVRVILAKEKEKITIENPFQFYGKTIENPRLKELGIQIEVVPVDQLENTPPNERGLALEYKQGGEKIQAGMFYNGAMNPVMAHPNWVMRTGGVPVELYHFESPNQITDELQLVLEVHPKVDDITLPVKIDDFPLP